MNRRTSGFSFVSLTFALALALLGAPAHLADQVDVAGLVEEAQAIALTDQLAELGHLGVVLVQLQLGPGDRPHRRPQLGDPSGAPLAGRCRAAQGG